MSIHVQGTTLGGNMFLVKIFYDGERSIKEVKLPYPPFVGLIIEGETVAWKIYEVRWILNSDVYNESYFNGCNSLGIFSCKAEIIQ